MTMAREQKNEIIEQFRLNEKDTGSPEVQIALLTNQHLTLRSKSTRRTTTPGAGS